MRITKAITDLRQQIHDDLRRQHPEWVLPNGESPMCDAYEARLMDLLALRPGSSYDAQSNGSTSEIRSTPQSSGQSKTIRARS
jgi:hypothetical protein